MAGQGHLVYRRGDILAVVAEGGHDFWLCKARQHVYEKVAGSPTNNFSVQWLERIHDDGGKKSRSENQGHGQGDQLYLLDTWDKVNLRSVIKRVRTKAGASKQGRRFFVLPVKEVKALTSYLTEDTDVSDADAEAGAKSTKGKNKVKRARTSGNDDGHRSSKKNQGKAKLPKVKVPVDKTDPNRRLKMRPHIQVLEKDPFFEEIRDFQNAPHISSLMWSKKLIAAVMCGDSKSLAKLKNSRDKVHSINSRRCVAVGYGPLEYAVLANNSEALRVLLQRDPPGSAPRVSAPPCFLTTSGTGHYNPVSLGRRNIRKVNLSRGGREGNNALTKVDDFLRHTYSDHSGLIKLALSYGCSRQTLNTLMAGLSGQFDDKRVENRDEDASVAPAMSHIHHALLNGHIELAAGIMRECTGESTYQGFSQYHVEAIEPFTDEVDQRWRKNLKEASCVKKGPKGMTPLHLACLNPDTRALQLLFSVHPDTKKTDEMNRELAHYAAVCRTSTEPLKFLVSHGASLENLDKNLESPLMHASRAGCAKNVAFILDHIKKNRGGVNVENEAHIKRFGVAGVDKFNKFFENPLTMAIKRGHFDCIKVLLEFGASANKQSNARFEKLSPLMKASAMDDLAAVRLMVEGFKANIGLKDSFRRTALIHAVMNGAAKVVSYLLHKGADPETADSSDNRCIHYAVAYGWYHCLVLLVEAGASLNSVNNWGLTPLAVSMLKGHSGLTQHLIRMPGIDPNSVDKEGRTVVLSMVSGSKSYDESTLALVEVMIDEYNLDPKVSDFAGMNALHHLAGPLNCGDPATLTTQERLQAAMVKVFLDRGCDSLALDSKGKLPLDLFMEHPLEKTCRKKNYRAIDFLLENMLDRMKRVKEDDEVATAFATPWSRTDDPNLGGILHSFAANLNILFADQEFDVLKKIASVIKCLPPQKQRLLVEKKRIQGHDQHSPIMTLCSAYAGSKVKHACYTSAEWNQALGVATEPAVAGTNAAGSEAVTVKDYQKLWGTSRSLIEFFIKTFQPELVYRVSVDTDSSSSAVGANGCSTTDGKAERTVTALSAILGPMSGTEEVEGSGLGLKPGFAMIFSKYSKAVDAADEFGKTLLVAAVESSNVKVASLLIDRGADINVYFDVKDTFYKLKVPKDSKGLRPVRLRSCPIALAIRNNSKAMVELLLSKGVDLDLKGTAVHLPQEQGQETRQSHVLHLAVKNCLVDRNDRSRLAILKSLLAAGADPNQVDEEARNVLHLAVNESTGHTDQCIDLEGVLLKHGVDLFQKDSLGRIPLHYVFVKLRNHKDSSKTDPIEVCGKLVEAMSGKMIAEPDVFGSTPLSYAAFRGATVSCLLLLKGHRASLEAVDNCGNTPLAHAVIGNHESCTLVLIKEGANINVTVNLLGKESIREKKVKVDLAEKMQQTQFLNCYRYFYNLQKTEDSASLATPLFECIVKNDWLGIVYIVTEKLESFGMSFALTVEVAIRLKKWRFANTLINKLADLSKLKANASQGRSLLCCLAFESKDGVKATDEPHLHDLVDVMLESGVDPMAKDNFGCTALHYACLHRQLILVKDLLAETGPDDSKALLNRLPAQLLNLKDSLGRTPLMAAFWNYPGREQGGGVDSEKSFVAFVDLLLRRGANPNDMAPMKPLSHLQGQHRHLTGDAGFLKPSATVVVSPLIIAVVHRDVSLIKTLIQHGANLSLPDDRGWTPLIHAVRTNDVDLVRFILSSTPKLAGLASPRTPSSTKRPRLAADVAGPDVRHKDKDGHTALHHAIDSGIDSDFGPFTYDNAEMVRLLLDEACGSGGLMSGSGAGGNAPLAALMAMAKRCRATKILTLLSSEAEATTALKSGAKGLGPGGGVDQPKFEPLARMGSSDFGRNAKDDARKMLRILELKAASEKKTGANEGHDQGGDDEDDLEQSSSDSDYSSNKEDDDFDDDGGCLMHQPCQSRGGPSDQPRNPRGDRQRGPKMHPGCIAAPGSSIHEEYQTLLNMVDTRKGHFYGVFNYYRMELWKEQKRDLWILFTNWGRIGDSTGQYQNTPFSNAESAETEFRKIFRSKTGNDWAEPFENKPGRYRVVKRDYVDAIKRHQIRIDIGLELDGSPPSRLCPEVRSIIADMTDVSMYIKAHKEVGLDTESMALGRVDNAQVERAAEILKSLRKVILEEKSKRSAGSATTIPGADKDEAVAQELQELNQRVLDLSSEYYFLMPKRGFEFTKLTPITDINQLDQEEQRVELALNLEVAERLLLAAQYHRKSLHPLDYVYNALGCTLEPLRPRESPKDAKTANFVMNMLYQKKSDGTFNYPFKVKNVFRVEIAKDRDKFERFTASGTGSADDVVDGGGDQGLNRHLLWHGTKKENLMGILHEGLLVNAISAIWTGSAYGKGIYFANRSEKSLNYSFSYDRNGRRTDTCTFYRYLLLVDVALGKMQTHNFCYCTDRRRKDEFPPKDHDSLLAPGSRYPRATVKAEAVGGLAVPIGDLVDRQKNTTADGRQCYCYYPHLDEYVVYNPEQAVVRYLVQLAVSESEDQ